MSAVIDTKNVTGRRELRFDSLDDLLAEAERLSATEVKPLGNWSLGQALEHLAISISKAVDGTSYRPSFLLRPFLRLMKNKFLAGPMPPGFKFPKAMAPEFSPHDNTSTEDGLAQMRHAIERFRSASVLKPNSAFGQMTREEWETLSLRHAEMHLSFFVPVEA